MGTKHPDLPGAELLYDGRTLYIQVLVNTDEPLNDVAARVQAAAKGPKKVMATAMASEMAGADAVKIWRGIWGKVSTIRKSQS
jgi:hypothetical protein